jgi:hypothetical protein
VPEVVTAGAVWVFLTCLVVSRVGLWGFDLVERQIMQENVAASDRGVINGVEYALTNVFALMSFALGMLANKPEQFGWLVGISFCNVATATALYTLWYRQMAQDKAPPSAAKQMDGDTGDVALRDVLVGKSGNKCEGDEADGDSN